MFSSSLIAKGRRFDGKTKDFPVTWERWKKDAIDKQIKTALGAARYLRSRRAVYLDQNRENPLPVPIPENPIIHKIIVAHGAKEACKAFSDDNVYGSIGVSYSEKDSSQSFPFSVSLKSSEKVHLLDTHNLEIILGELDTFHDLSEYFLEKERAIDQYALLSYCGEEDLLAHYLLNYNEKHNRYQIEISGEDLDGFHIDQGGWHDLRRSDHYKRRREANKSSYLWDNLIQKTSDHFLAGTSGGNADIFAGESAIKEMAREPRFMRRDLSDRILERFAYFSSNPGKGSNLIDLSLMNSFYPDTRYVFLQLQSDYSVDYEGKYRALRRYMLEIACGVTKNKYPHLTRVVGIAMDAPKHAKGNSEDFFLLPCDEWPEDQRAFFEEQNKELCFFESPNLRVEFGKAQDFPSPDAQNAKVKPGRNDPCPCRSGRKFKKCCLPLQRRGAVAR